MIAILKQIILIGTDNCSYNLALPNITALFQYKWTIIYPEMDHLTKMI